MLPSVSMPLNPAAAGNGATARLFHVGRPRRAVPEPRCYPKFNVMRKSVISILALSCMSCLGLAQEQALPAIRILPEDIVQESVQEFRMGTNKYAVRWTYTEAGAKKMLAFRKAHDGEEVITRVDNFESRGKIIPRKSYPAGWVNDEGWLKSRTDKFFGVSEEDAKTIKSGLKSR
jgi:hypothetical protein